MRNNFLYVWSFAADLLELPTVKWSQLTEKDSSDRDAAPAPANSAGVQPSSEGAGSPVDDRRRSGQLRTRERNRKAQHAYRQRNKVKHQQQEHRIQELEKRIAVLQQNRLDASTQNDTGWSGSMHDVGSTQMHEEERHQAASVSLSFRQQNLQVDPLTHTDACHQIMSHQQYQTLRICIWWGFTSPGGPSHPRD
ncbi:hypothetical protein WJX84_000653 [Apatococcus fuscideae]|uniref:BZIP domain-containing protein n=1 Tax=Apatococcus fuscideae TaxID=2026836 RepID=A0AAW1TDW4_9CHLO